jgi:DNA-binding PadR family transcriptional regulator
MEGSGMEVSLTSLQEFGLSQKDLFYIFIFHAMESAPQHGSALYERLKQTFSMKSPSRTHFYVALREMHQKHGWLTLVSEEGRKRVYQLTHLGSEKKQWYQTHYLQKFQSIFYLNQLFLYEFARQGQKAPLRSLTKTEQQYFSKCINVKNLVRLFILRDLYKKKEVIGADVRGKMRDRFGWQASETYFYDIIHHMEEEGWIRGYWPSQRRYKRLLQLQPKGEEWYPHIEQETVKELRAIHHFLKAILMLFSSDQKATI